MALDLLTQDWLTALGIAKSLDLDVKRLWTQVSLDKLLPGSPVAYVLDFKENASGRAARILVAAETQAWTLIERVEVLLSALSHAELWLQGKGQHAALRENQTLCYRLGCWTGDELSARERWRLLAMLMPLQNLRIAPLEDRPVCGICHLRMASGSITRTPNGNTVHDHCLDFAQLVMLPALREQREREQRERELDGVHNAD